jgi:hypothetical protein
MLSVEEFPRMQSKLPLLKLLPLPSTAINLLPSRLYNNSSTCVRSTTYVAPKQSKPSSEQQDTLGGMIFWMFLVLLIIGGGVLFFIMRGKFKASRKISAVWITSQSTSELQRDIQRVSTDVKKLEEEWDTDMTDIEYVKKLYEEK